MYVLDDLEPWLTRRHSIWFTCEYTGASYGEDGRQIDRRKLVNRTDEHDGRSFGTSTNTGWGKALFLRIFVRTWLQGHGFATPWTTTRASIILT